MWWLQATEMWLILTFWWRKPPKFKILKILPEIGTFAMKIGAKFFSTTPSYAHSSTLNMVYKEQRSKNSNGPVCTVPYVVFPLFLLNKAQ